MHTLKIALFTLVKSKWLISGSLTYHNNVDDVETCARYCVSELKCLSFDYSGIGKRCFLNLLHGSQADLRPQNSYSHYSRNTLEGYYSRPSFEVYTLLDQMIRSKQFSLRVSSIESFDFIMLNATSIEDAKDHGQRYGISNLFFKSKDHKVASILN